MTCAGMTLVVVRRVIGVVSSLDYIALQVAALRRAERAARGAADQSCDYILHPQRGLCSLALSGLSCAAYTTPR